jgi:biopolymer transport protein TolR
MAALSNAGFTKINLITETGGPSSGAAPRDAQPEGSGDLRPAQ